MSYFLAVDLDDPVREQVAATIRAHQAAFPAKWIRPERLHVTVLFLGSPAHPAPLCALMRSVASAFDRFELRLSGSGTFETARAASVLWLGVAGDLGQLEALRAAALDTFGAHVPAEERTRLYRPHLTLGRSSQLLGFEPIREALSALQTKPFTAAHLSLYESTGVGFRLAQRVAFSRAAG